MTVHGRQYAAYLAEVNGRLRRRLQESLEFVNWKDRVKRDSTVLVKPNFTFPQHRAGVTTSPELLRVLLEILRSRSGRVIVGESDGGNGSFRAEEAFSGHGMYDICKELGVDLVNLSRLPSKFLESRVHSKKVNVQIPKLLLDEVDCFISAPVFKIHVMTNVSLGIKNLWGCHPDTMRGLHHRNLDYKLVLLTRILNPAITVIDGLCGLDRHGPMFGNPVKMDLILASNNVVLADAIGTLIMGFEIDRVKHIMLAHEEGLGPIDVTNSKINADWRLYQRHFQIQKTPLDKISRLMFCSDILSRLVMSSPLTPFIYTVARALRTPEEKVLAEANQVSRKTRALVGS